jgi:chorismate synthase
VEDYPEDDAAAKKLLAPRPGHADLAGSQKFDFHDARYVLERASARETAARVAAGALAKQLLHAFGVESPATPFKSATRASSARRTGRKSPPSRATSNPPCAALTPPPRKK